MKSEWREESVSYFGWPVPLSATLTDFSRMTSESGQTPNSLVPLVVGRQLYVSTVITLVVMAIFISIYYIVHSKTSLNTSFKREGRLGCKVVNPSLHAKAFYLPILFPSLK